MYGINSNIPHDPNPFEQALAEAERKLALLNFRQAVNELVDSLVPDEDYLPLRDLTRIDLSKPANFHEAVDLLRHMAELGNPAEADKLANVLAAALDTYPSIRQLTGATWALILLKMLDRAITIVPTMPSSPKN